MWNRVFACPSIIAFPLLYVAGDLSGLLGESDGIAHLAHLIGLCTGLAGGFILSAANPLEDVYLSPFEKRMHIDLRSAPDSLKRTAAGNAILELNPENWIVMHDVFEQNLKEYKHDWGREEEKFWNRHFAEFVAAAIKNGAIEKVEKLIEAMPLEMNLTTLVAEVSQVNLLLLADRQVRKENLICAVRLYDVFMGRYTFSPQLPLVRKTVRNIMARLLTGDTEENRQVSAVLTDYLAKTKRSAMRGIIDEMMLKIEQEGWSSDGRAAV